MQSKREYIKKGIILFVYLYIEMELAAIEVRNKWKLLEAESAELVHVTKISRKRKMFTDKEEKEEEEFSNENPQTILITGANEVEGMEFDQDDYFYRGEILTSFAKSSYVISTKLDQFSLFYQERRKRNNMKAEIPFVHDNNFYDLLAMVMTKPVEPIKVGGDPKRVGHACYMCGKQTDAEYRDLLCSPCIEENNKHKKQKLNLLGKVALVTGIRIKVGYEVALRLLRNNATVLFPFYFYFNFNFSN